MKYDGMFSGPDLRNVLASHFDGVVKQLDRLPEDQVLRRAAADLVDALVSEATVDPLVIGKDVIDGGVDETSVDLSNGYEWGQASTVGYEVNAVYEFTGDPQLFKARPSQWLMVSMSADIGDGELTIRVVISGRATDPKEAQRAIDETIGRIRTMAEYSAADVRNYNATLTTRFEALVKKRKDAILARRDLAGALGFPLTRRPDAPAAVPVQRKNIGVQRTASAKTIDPYQDEPALTSALYEDAIKVVQSTLLAMERTPSVASGKPEEELRDQILVQLNGTFEGGATGETFVQKGKTDLLIQVGDRHVFVGECKWWSGEKACGEAVDQLLGYLPWRDEKSALILFINRKDATAIMDKAEQAVRFHPAYKRAGAKVTDPNSRRNFVLGQPGDPEREIELAVLFAVLPA